MANNQVECGSDAAIMDMVPLEQPYDPTLSKEDLICILDSFVDDLIKECELSMTRVFQALSESSLNLKSV